MRNIIDSCGNLKMATMRRIQMERIATNKGVHFYRRSTMEVYAARHGANIKGLNEQSTVYEPTAYAFLTYPTRRSTIW